MHPLTRTLAAIALFLVAGLPAAAQDRSPLWELEPQADPRIAAGKVTVVSGTLAGGVTRFVIKDISVDQPVQLTLGAVDPEKPVTVEVYKHSWESPLVSKTTNGAVPATVRFRSGNHAAFIVRGPEGAVYELFAWVGPAIQAGPPRAVVPMDAFVKTGGTASKTTPGLPSVAAASGSGSGTTSGSGATAAPPQTAEKVEKKEPEDRSVVRPKPRPEKPKAKPPQTAEKAGAALTGKSALAPVLDEISGNPLLYGLLAGVAVLLAILIGVMARGRRRRRNLPPKEELKLYSFALLAACLGLGLAAMFMPGSGHAQEAGSTAAGTAVDPKPVVFDIQEAKTQIGAELQKLAAKLETIGIAGTTTFDPRSRIGDRILEFYVSFGLIDLREAAIQPQFAPKGLPELPSRCQQAQVDKEFTSDAVRRACRICMSSAEASLDTWRMRLEAEWVKYRITEFTAGRVLELAPAADGLTPSLKIKWEPKTETAPDAHLKANQAYYETYDRLLKEFSGRVDTALRDMAACEAKHFSDREWYERYAHPYLGHISERYSRR